MGNGFVIRLLVLLLGCASACVASAQPMDLRIDRDPAVEDYDFSWVYWFETRGQRYVHESLSDRPLPWDTPASRRWRSEVVESLESMLDDGDDRVRAAAVLALGRIGHEPLADTLLGSVELGRSSLLLDESQDVRVSAWLALGLLDLPATRLSLSHSPLVSATEIDRAAQAVAIGLLSRQVEIHVKWLIERLDDGSESLEVKRWCVWSLKRLKTDVDLNESFVFGAVMRELPSTFLIGEVLLSPGYVGANGGSDLLIDVLRYHPDMRRWPGYLALSVMPSEGKFGSTPRRLAMETRVAAALTIAELPRPAEQEGRQRLLAHLKRRIEPGTSSQAMDFNRGFDLLAYVMHCDVSEEDLGFLYDQLRGFAVLPPDDPAVVEKLKEDDREGEVPEPDDLRERQSDNEVRSYAALATGLLIRRATEGTRLHRDRPIVYGRGIEVERLKRRFGIRLLRAVADGDEPMAYRAACALAIGLSGDDRYRADLTAELNQLRRGDEAVLGYGLLALAMLGEDRVVDPATRYVTRPGAVKGAGDRLGRLAAMRAVGLTDWRQAELADEILKGVWGRDPWLGLHAAETTAMLGRYAAVPSMIKATKSESANWRLAAVRSLGVAFDASYPSKLSQLTESMNPTLTLRPRGEEKPRDAFEPLEPLEPLEVPGLDPATGWPMGRLYAIGNPFLFEVLRELEPVAEAQPERSNPQGVEVPSNR